MTKKVVALVSVLMFMATPGLADWAGSFKAVDSDGSGTISRAEWDAGGSKVDPTYNPTLQTMDTNNDNSVDADEWKAAEGMKKAIGKGCKASGQSWCPCQNNSSDPECQK